MLSWLAYAYCGVIVGNPPNKKFWDEISGTITLKCPNLEEVQVEAAQMRYDGGGQTPCTVHIEKWVWIRRWDDDQQESWSGEYLVLPSLVVDGNVLVGAD